MDRRVETSQRERSLQESKQPGKAIRPPDIVNEVSVNERTALVVRRRTRQDGDANDDEAGDRPEESGLRDVRQHAVEERINHQRDERKGDVDQKLVPRLGLVGRVKQRNGLHDERAAQESSRRRQRHPASHVDPARDIADAATPPFPRHDGRPVVLAAGGRPRRQELGQRRRQAQVADPCHHQTPDDGARATRRQR